MRPIHPMDRCPCGQSKKIGVNCCLQPGNTMPPEPKTGISLPRCYAASLADCSETLSLEHYWSHAIQKLIAPNGVLTLRDEEGVVLENVPVKILGSNVLCVRHNTALSGVDATALRFFQSGPEIVNVLNGKRTPSAVRCFDGESLERWIMKTICALLCAGLLKRKDGTRLPREVPLHWLPLLFGSEQWPPSWGLYLPTKMGQQMNFTAESLDLAPIDLPVQREGAGARALAGAIARLGGVESILCLGNPGTHFLFRPNQFNIENSNTRARLTYRFYWAHRRSEAA